MLDEDLLVYLQEVFSLHAWLSRRAAQEHYHVCILEHLIGFVSILDRLYQREVTILKFQDDTFENFEGGGDIKESDVEVDIGEDIAAAKTRNE